MKKMFKKGFTLVELLVVIAILAILATVSIVGYTAFIQKANETKATTELDQIKKYVIAEDINNDDFFISATNGFEWKAATGENFDAKVEFGKIKEAIGKTKDITSDMLTRCDYEDNKTVYYTVDDVKAVWHVDTGVVEVVEEAAN